jgi:hypothetical protein
LIRMTRAGILAPVQISTSRSRSRLLHTDNPQKCVGGGGQRCGILPSNQTVIHDRERLPVADFFKDRAKTQQFILDKERHNFGELNLFFLAIRDPG